jgi:hypothetical protein
VELSFERQWARIIEAIEAEAPTLRTKTRRRRSEQRPLTFQERAWQQVSATWGSDTTLANELAKVASASAQDGFSSNQAPATLLAWQVGCSAGANGVSDEDSQGTPADSPIRTDRPTFTPTSSTVGKNTIQLETGYKFIHDRSQGVTVDSHSYPEANLRFGVLADWLEGRVGQNFVSTHTGELANRRKSLWEGRKKENAGRTLSRRFSLTRLERLFRSRLESSPRGTLFVTILKRRALSHLLTSVGELG